MYRVILKSLKDEGQWILLYRGANLVAAQEARKNWRKVLGDKLWTVDRRPGLDTLDHLAIKLEKEPER